jgi:hypothetical protein
VHIRQANLNAIRAAPIRARVTQNLSPLPFPPSGPLPTHQIFSRSTGDVTGSKENRARTGEACESKACETGLRKRGLRVGIQILLKRTNVVAENLNESLVNMWRIRDRVGICGSRVWADGVRSARQPLSNACTGEHEPADSVQLVRIEASGTSFQTHIVEEEL